MLKLRYQISKDGVNNMLSHWQRLSFVSLLVTFLIIGFPSLSVARIFSPTHQATIILSQDSTSSQETLPQDKEKTETNDNQKPSSQSNKQEDAENNQQLTKPADVVFNGESLFPIMTDLGEISPEQRAKDISSKIESVANDYSVNPESLEIVSLDTLKLLQADDILIFALGEADAQAANTSLSELAEQRLITIKEAIIEFRESRTQESIVKGTILAIGATILFIFALIILNRTLPIIFNKIVNWQQQRFSSIRFQRLQFLSGSQVSEILQTLFKIIRYSLLFITFYVYIPFLLGCFPWTRPIGKTLLRYFWKAVNLVFGGLIGYLPNVFIIAVIVFLAYYAIRFARFLFNALKWQRIRINGFYPEWADPTYNITLFLILGLATVLIVPYLPASDSPGFQGVSLFLGALFTLGSTAIIGNIISGIVLIYTRSFQEGDLIKANGITGKVIEKTMLSTRLLNFDNEIITIPNGSLITSEITNYTAVLRDNKKPLILKTTITLGYDVPWRKVHQVLLEAAKSSDGVLDDPQAFVLQTSLDDFYVSYTLKVYTKEPEKMGAIYSQLHQNIQDRCNEADIEILSPHYSAVRDGNQITIPSDYLPDDYQAPSFRLESLSNFLNPYKNKE